MSAVRKVIPETACPGVVAAAQKTAVVATLDVAIAADRLAEMFDNAGIAHHLNGKFRKVDEKAMTLSGEAFDFALLQQPSSPFDALLLCLVAVDRYQLVYDTLDEDVRSIADAIETAMHSFGAWLTTQCGPDQLRGIPERFRSRAEDWLGNAIGPQEAREAFK